MTLLKFDPAAFNAAVTSLQPSFERLLGMEPISYGQLPATKHMPRRGIYLFSEGEDYLYVGRSNNLRRRYRDHCSGDHNKAAFEMRLAREKTNKRATYTAGKDDVKSLMQDAGFKEAFFAAQDSIRKMEFRYVEQTCPIRQALLEIYCALALKARHNDFENH